MQRVRSWRQQIKIHPARTTFQALIAAVLVLIILIFLGYIFNWDWTGLNGYKTISTATSSPPKITTTITYQSGKTLWDWLQLLIIPAVLAVAGYVINLSISRGEQAATEQRAKSEQEAAEKRAETERKIALDNQREESLQSYFDKISELMLHENLQKAELGQAPIMIARARTLTVLQGLDARRKGNVIEFLYESNLLGDMPFIPLHGVNLNDAILPYARLRGAFFDGAQFHNACLTGADLSNTILYANDLSGADLRNADLSGANIAEADLSNANLLGATISIEQLAQVKSLKGATLPDGTIHP